MDRFNEKIDFSNFNQEDLKSALFNIDREKFPENYANLVSEIENRKSQGKWNETQSQFNDLIATRKGAWLLVCILYIPLYLVLSGLYALATDSERPAWFTPAFGVIYFSFAFFVQYKLAQMKCPNCKKPFGFPPRSNLGNRDKCPKCGYRVKT